MTIQDVLNFVASYNFSWSELRSLDLSAPQSWLLLAGYAALGMVGIELGKWIEPHIANLERKLDEMFSDDPD
jgi:hypothetical protein